ncbi:MAG: bifunctional 5,10-methylenetetrahydrofolate dehydrogenase/5,10-methenyltetrahydrofolate cyclohydrolase [Candidatus Paceibacterota bacterium]|jgi:methylenetetrahydrofolate dehydrogenase (NADP+)/methenyltetrahydrofolate cyclohydrolase
MTEIVDGKKIAGEILARLKERVSKMNIKPTLAVVLVGDDEASRLYVGKKEAAAKDVGIKFLRFEFPESITKEALITELKKIQAENNLSGMIVQFPLPEKLWPDAREIVNNINPNIDVDCLSHISLGRVLMKESKIVPPTPGAVLEILKYHGVDLTGKNVCLVGRGDLVGKPLAAMLIQMPITLSVHGRSTKNLADYTRQADIIISGVGKAGLITADMVKDGAVVIDAGTAFSGGKTVGDVDFDSVKTKASIITLVPGGVGPITVAKLLENTVDLAEH